MKTASEKACAPMGKRYGIMKGKTDPGVVGPSKKKKGFVPFKKKGKARGKKNKG